MKHFVIFLGFLCMGAIAFAQKTDNQLEKKLTALLKDFKGVAGVYVHHLKKNTQAAVHADTVFPTASMVKVPILVGIMDKLEKGELHYHQSLTYTDSLLYAGEDILGSFKSGEKIELSKVMMLMLTTSDNTASLWLQSLAGTGTRINALMDSLGLPNTRVNSRTPGREANRGMYGWGQTTPREMATLMEKIFRAQVISPAACERMLRHLKRNYWDQEGISQLPPAVNTFTKNGAVNASRSEVMLVNAPHGDYVFCIITKNQADQSWKNSNEGFVLLRRVTKLLWQYFEPKYPWEPAPGMEKYQE
jgi:beta-lactamase class A